MCGSEQEVRASVCQSDTAAQVCVGLTLLEAEMIA